ncbi:proton-coupled folate transporter-like [Branchiostoma lanceolatum]|uniref:proton-coupled folate transporter-like n=1 Tax=Branchiostoma lanceolatum TaxID=7740 RepID=UPI003453D94E
MAALKDETQTLNHSTGVYSETRPLLERDSNDNRSGRRGAPVEPLTILVLLAGFFQDNVYDQYFYYFQCRRYNVTFSFDSNASKCDNTTTPEHENQILAQSQAARMSLYHDVALYSTVCLSSILLGVLSDRSRRRKIAIVPSVFAGMVKAAVYLLFISLNLPFYAFLLPGVVLSGSLCYTFSAIVGIYAYMADTTCPHQRTYRLAVLYMCEGIGAGAAYFLSGYWLDRQRSFTNPIWLSLGLFGLCFFYSAFLVRDNPHEEENPPFCVHFRKIGGLFKARSDSDDKRWRLWCYYIGHLLDMFSQGGFSVISTLYMMDSPFCWDPTAVGTFHASLNVGTTFFSVVGIRLFRRWMDDHWIAQIGMASHVLGCSLMAFAPYLPNRNIILYFVPCAMILNKMQTSVLRARMSLLVDQDQQGLIFALSSSVAGFLILLQSVVFLSVYRATLHWFPGFGFLLAAAVDVLVAAMVAFLHCHVRASGEASVNEAKIN